VNRIDEELPCRRWLSKMVGDRNSGVKVVFVKVIGNVRYDFRRWG
jgi:hypothetical protein